MEKFFHDDNPVAVMSLLFVALFSMLLMFQISYSGASFNGVERAPIEMFSPRQISPAFDNMISIIAENLQWSISTAAAEAKSPVLSFLGLEGYKYGQARSYSAISKARANDWKIQAEARVLGARISSSAYRQ
jgi:hypothetical protein